MTVFWVVGAVILAVIAWYVILYVAANVIVGVEGFLWFLVRLPYFIVLGFGIPRARSIDPTEPVGWRVPGRSGYLCAAVTLLLAPIFHSTF
jgi:hypothetical protein